MKLNFYFISFYLLYYLSPVYSFNSLSNIRLLRTNPNFLISSNSLISSHSHYPNNLLPLTSLKMTVTQESRSAPSVSPSLLWLRKYNLPDKLTIGRVVSIPIFIWAYSQKQYFLASWIFFLSSVTDFLDGYLARKLQQSTNFGAFLDPVADKLLVGTSIILLCTQLNSLWFSIPTAVIICREIAVSALREWMSERKLRNVVQVGLMGKLKTCLTMISIYLLLISMPALEGARSGPTKLSVFQQVVKVWNRTDCWSSYMIVLGLFLYLLAAIATVLSGAAYFVAAAPVLRK